MLKEQFWERPYREGVPTSGVAFMRGPPCEEKVTRDHYSTTAGSIEPLHGAG